MSYPSDHKLGYAGRRVGKHIEKACVTSAELIAEIIDDLTDGDNDTRRALKAANLLGLKNVHLFDVGANLADGNLADAEAAGQRLNGIGD